MTQSFLWISFAVVILFMLVLDLGVFHRKSHIVKVREALIWSAAWATLAAIFAVVLFMTRGQETALNFTAGYLVELSLSIDNLFVIILIFSYFRVPATYQHRVLFWGIFGAVIMRALFIVGGIALVERFSWMMYLFGAFLVFTSVKIALHKDNEEVHPDKNLIVRAFRRLMPVTSDYEGPHFFVKKQGRHCATPLFIALLVVESSDVIFAVDSIPAIFGITLDPFVVYTSNIFAILGLRSLYFALSGMIDKFHHLEHGLAFILAFIGAKMLLGKFYHVPIWMSLAVIVGTILVTIATSLVWRKKL